MPVPLKKFEVTAIDKEFRLTQEDIARRRRGQLKPSDLVRGTLEMEHDKYSFWELGMWIHMLTTQAAKRKTDERKRYLCGARDFLRIMNNKLEAMERQ